MPKSSNCRLQTSLDKLPALSWRCAWPGPQIVEQNLQTHAEARLHTSGGTLQLWWTAEYVGFETLLIIFMASYIY